MSDSFDGFDLEEEEALRFEFLRPILKMVMALKLMMLRTCDIQ